MIVLGIILLLIGWLAHISILVTIGVIVLVIGLVLHAARRDGTRRRRQEVLVLTT